eukprot:1468952-Pyramimonas_sp.AAC.1
MPGSPGLTKLTGAVLTRGGGRLAGGDDRAVVGRAPPKPSGLAHTDQGTPPAPNEDSARERECDSNVNVNGRAHRRTRPERLEGIYRSSLDA